MTPVSASRLQSHREEISVVLPVRNMECFVAEALGSILRQSLRPAEVIVVDDRSTDRTRRLVEAAAAVTEIPVRIIQGPGEGLAAAHNAGAAAAAYPWIAIMHADDVARIDRLERQMAAARAHPDVLVWGSHAYHIDRGGRVTGRSASGCTSVAGYRRAFRSGQITGNVIHSSALFRRSTFEEVGGYDGAFDGAEDLELFERIAELGPVVALPETLMQRRIHPGSVTARSYRRIQLLKRYLELRARHRAMPDGALPMLEDFLAGATRQPLPSRIADGIRDYGEYLYHRAGLSFSTGRHAATAAYLAASVACNPPYALRRSALQVGGLLSFSKAAFEEGKG